MTANEEVRAYCRQRKRYKYLANFSVWEDCDDYITLALAHAPTASFYQFVQDAKFEPHGFVYNFTLDEVGYPELPVWLVTLRKLPGHLAAVEAK